MSDGTGKNRKGDQVITTYFAFACSIIIPRIVLGHTKGKDRRRSTINNAMLCHRTVIMQNTI